MFLYFLLISYVPLFFVFFTVHSSMQTHYISDRENKLLTSANIIATNVEKSNYLYSDALRGMFYEELATKSKEGSFRVLVLDNRGFVLNDTNRTDIGRVYLVPEVMEALQKNTGLGTHPDEQAIYAASCIISDTSQKEGVVLLIASIEDVYAAMYEIEQQVIIFTIILTGIIGLLAFFVSRLLISPVHDILAAVRKMSEGHLHQRIEVNGQDEFTELSLAFNDMTQKLEEVETIRGEFVSNVSHELKTPLSSIKVLTESILLQENVPIEMYNEFLQDINSEIDRMTNIVSDLLSLVRLDQGEVALNVRPMDLNIMCEEILKRLYPLAEQKKIELLYEDVRKVIIDGDEMKLTLAISNLVENGIKYTPHGGIVKLTVDADHQNGFITVQDTGVGIEDKEHDKIFNRFYRVDKTRDRETGGTGLGLAITRTTVLMHNGSIRVYSKENEGATFVVRLPIHYNA